MMSAVSTLSEACSFGDNCRHPANELMRPCNDNCFNNIHMSCSPYDQCPFHVYHRSIIVIIMLAIVVLSDSSPCCMVGGWLCMAMVDA